MTATTEQGASAHGTAEVYSSQGLIPKPPSGKSALHEHMGDKTGATIAAGVATFRDIVAPWTVWYDEVLILHSTDGEFELELDGQIRPMKPGDMAWLPAGTTVSYRARGEAVLFYAVTPNNWQSVRPT